MSDTDNLPPREFWESSVEEPTRPQRMDLNEITEVVVLLFFGLVTGCLIVVLLGAIPAILYVVR
jgi:hypothetical protein